MSSIAWGFLGGFIAWVATDFIGQPIRTFFSARSEAARALIRYAHLDDYDPEKDSFVPRQIISERERILADSGSQLEAFSDSNQLISLALRKFKLNPKRAGEELNLLSKMKPHGINNEDRRQNIMRYLRLGRKFGKNTRI